MCKRQMALLAMFLRLSSEGLVPVISSEIAVYFKSYPGFRSARWEDIKKKSFAHYTTQTNC